ncbi:hypothetical protein DFJ73DRAFT_165263 [Zopfochytrium polystomum]|nr:hypothetical protein DFJ73DRAFT_165263 [Zopfochytrium polystomum]
MRQSLLGLEAMHQAGFAHLDSKPWNIFVGDTQDPPIFMIGDFGIAQEISDKGQCDIAHETEFMEPLDASGEGEGNSRLHDIYAVGMMLSLFM